MANILDPFANMKDGTTRSFGSFTGSQVGAPAAGGVTVIRGQESSAGAIDNWLMRGYALKDATSAVSAAAGADLNKVNAALRPEESAANNTQTLAQANVQNTTARLMPAESTARIAGINADIGNTNANAAQTRAATKAKTYLNPAITPEMVQAVANGTLWRFSDSLAPRRP